MNRNQSAIFHHIKKYHLIYFFMIILFLIGIIFGAIIVNSMGVIQRQNLFFYVDQFLSRLLEGPIISNQEILKTSFFYHFQYLALFFILGLSVIGLPIIWVLIFVKGVVVGFSVGFFVNQLGWKGLLFAAASIAPQNLISIPIYLLASSLAMIFSFHLIQKIFSRRLQKEPIAQYLMQYMIIFVVLIACLGGASIVEAFVSNPLMDWITNRFY
ncbi:stage II sporulation protein M [Paraliobacillus ryukyuensis]|uniref:Stage II sporulation protein M n=1 Tax=Paraliobacillus ryukyuensis TaxID=200904 RepID=A0A366EJ75_9BACI|nr:stage II sporulation protein M [Paraliobacillus ryukyuensis]RBP01475.1 stage II sporulation protein M [Paraliobacillus ryukyuensis]